MVALGGQEPYRCLDHHEQSILDAAMPRWDELRFTWDELKILPSKWKAALSQWRGIYFIFDESDGKGYVGSAYGTENIVGRWLSYAAGAHGGNKELRNRDPARFRFSILVPPPGLLLYLQYASPALLAAGEVA